MVAASAVGLGRVQLPRQGATTTTKKKKKRRTTMGWKEKREKEGKREIERSRE